MHVGCPIDEELLLLFTVGSLPCCSPQQMSLHLGIWRMFVGNKTRFSAEHCSCERSFTGRFVICCAAYRRGHRHRYCHFRKAVKAALAGLLVVIGASAFDDPEQLRTDVEQRGTEILKSGIDQLPPESQDNARSLLSEAETEVRSWLSDENVNDLFDRLSNGPARLSDAVENFDSGKGVLPTEIQPIFNTDSSD